MDERHSAVTQGTHAPALDYATCGYALGGLLAGIDAIYRTGSAKKPIPDLPAFVQKEFPDFLQERSFFRIDRSKEKNAVYPTEPRHHAGVSGLANSIHIELRQYARAMASLLEVEKLPRSTREALVAYEQAVGFYGQIIAAHGGNPHSAAKEIRAFNHTFEKTVHKLKEELETLTEVPLRIGKTSYTIPNHTAAHERLLLHPNCPSSQPALVLFALKRNAHAMIDKAKEPPLSFKFLYEITGFETSVTETMRSLEGFIQKHIPQEVFHDAFPVFHENAIRKSIQKQTHQLRLLHDFLEILGVQKQPAIVGIETLLAAEGKSPTLIHNKAERLESQQELACLIYAIRKSFATHMPAGAGSPAVIKELETIEQEVVRQPSLKAAARMVQQNPVYIECFSKALSLAKVHRDKVPKLEDAILFVAQNTLNVRIESKTGQGF